MRFVVSDWSRNSLLKVVVVLFVLFVVGLWLTNIALYFGHMDLSAESVRTYYLGDEEHFLEPRSFRSMVEVAHYHLFAMGMLLMTLTHLMLFVPLSIRVKVWLIVVPFASAVLDEGAGWLVRFGSPSFAWLKVAGFLSLEGSLAVLIGTCLWSVFAGSNAAWAGQDEDDDDDES